MIIISRSEIITLFVVKNKVRSFFFIYNYYFLLHRPDWLCSGGGSTGVSPSPTLGQVVHPAQPPAAATCSPIHHQNAAMGLGSEASLLPAMLLQPRASLCLWELWEEVAGCARCQLHHWKRRGWTKVTPNPSCQTLASYPQEGGDGSSRRGF